MPIKVYQYNLKEKYDSEKQNPFSKDESEMLYDGKIMKILHALNNKSPQIIELNHEGLLELLQQEPCTENIHNRLMKDFGMPSISTTRSSMLKKKDFVDSALSSGSHHVKHKKGIRRKKHRKKATHKHRKKATHKHRKKATHKHRKKASKHRRRIKH